MVARSDFAQFGLSKEQLRKIHQAERAVSNLTEQLGNGIDPESVMVGAIIVSQDIRGGKFPPTELPSKQLMDSARRLTEQLEDLIKSHGLTIDRPLATGMCSASSRD